MNPAGTWIEDSDLSWEINEPDAYALEAGLQLKEKLTGEVVVLCAGPERAAQTIREALAKGADRAIHIETGKAGASDPLALARMMASALESEKPDLILTGLQSDDLGYGQTGVIMAEVMGLPHATIIMNIEADGSGIKVKRELEDGWFQQVEMPLPALLTIQSGATKLRYATLMGIKKAKTKEINGLRPRSGGAKAAASIRRRADLHAREDQAVADLRRPAERGGREAGGEAAVRGARYMSGVC